MHYGLQAIVLALSSMEVLTENEPSTDKEPAGTAIYLQQLREHLDAITTPVRRVLEHLIKFCCYYHILYLMMYLVTIFCGLRFCSPTLIIFL